MIYFDNASTRMPIEGIQLQLAEQLTSLFANPSSLHHEGILVKRRLDEVRTLILEEAKVSSELIFTSGATEANNMVIRSFFEAGKHVITSAYEHPSVREVINQFEQQGMAVTRLTTVDDEHLLQALQDNTVLVSIMGVNNEVGLRFDLNEAVKELQRRHIPLHRDCVQVFHKFPLPKADFLTISGHKVGALKGVGAILTDRKHLLKPLLLGGSQEFGLRPGTENVAGILSMGLALQHKEDLSHVECLNKALREGLHDKAGVISPLNASPYILSISVDVPSEIVMNALNQKQIYISAGSACSSRSTHRSYTAQMMGLSEQERSGVLRISLCSDNTLEEVQTLVLAIRDTVDMIRKVIR